MVVAWPTGSIGWFVEAACLRANYYKVVWQKLVVGGLFITKKVGKKQKAFGLKGGFSAGLEAIYLTLFWAVWPTKKPKAKSLP